MSRAGEGRHGTGQAWDGGGMEQGRPVQIWDLEGMRQGRNVAGQAWGREAWDRAGMGQVRSGMG